MLRVGLTGGLGSGKSAAALVFAEGGAHVLSSDEIGRSMMQPGEAVYAQIVKQFGSEVLTPEGVLDRRALARQAFERGRLEELNAIVHPVVLAAQEERIAVAAAKDPAGIVVIESALIFEAAGVGSGLAAAWRLRFDRLVLITAPDELKIARYVARHAPPRAEASALERLARDGRARLAAQMPDAEKAPLCDYVIENTGSLVQLRRRVQAVLVALRAEADSDGRATAARTPGSHR